MTGRKRVPEAVEHMVAALISTSQRRANPGTPSTSKNPSPFAKRKSSQLSGG